MSTPGAKRPVNSDLSEDVILDILLRLPVKTLLRIKCVCKLWYAIITGQSFINQHLRHVSNRERLLIRYRRPNEDLHRHAFALSVDETCSEFEEPDHLQMPHIIEKIMGPVNGVFCLVGESRDQLALLNPATRQLKPLPKRPDVFVERHLHFRENVVGFGLDPLSGDFKVVSIWYLSDFSATPDEDSPRPSLVFVYNSGSNSWKNVAPFKSRADAVSSYFNNYLNGAYYWILEYFYARVGGILAFDMRSEKFREIEVPECVKSKEGYVTMYGDSVALLAYDENENETGTEIWVMEKDESWNRIAVVGPFEPISWPICFWKKNELILQNDTFVLNLYDMCTTNIRPLAVRLGENTSLLSWVFSYNESLVSIKGEGDNCLMWDASVGILKIAWAKEHRSPRRYGNLRLL